MTKDESLKISAEIASMINSGDLVIDYSESEIKGMKLGISDVSLEGYRHAGLLGDCVADENEFEKFCVIKKLCDKLDIWRRTDDRYLRELFGRARMFTVREFYRDPYLLNIFVPITEIGDFALRAVTYDRGEIFQHEMPDFESDIVVPRLGFFPELVAFPSIYEGTVPWVSVCPSEISSMQTQIKRANGRVLVLGLGLGYYPYIVSGKANVSEITIVERQPEIIELFEKNILPQFADGGKIRIVRSDAYEFLDSVRVGQYDFCFADIWEGQMDGATSYLRIKEYEERLPGTEFTYWIEEQILSYLRCS